MAKDKTARDVALEVLLRVEQTRSYANLLLAPALAKSSLSSRDRALTTELVYLSLIHISLTAACQRAGARLTVDVDPLSYL